MRAWRFAILFVVILAGGFVVNAWEYLGEVHVERKELREFPRQVGPGNRAVAMKSSIGKRWMFCVRAIICSEITAGRTVA